MINPTEYLPKSYRTRVSTYWWLTRWPYLKFILREASSVFVAWIVIVTLLQIQALSRGPAEYAEFQNWLRNPLMIALNVISLLFVIFHTQAPRNAQTHRMIGERNHFHTALSCGTRHLEHG